jgi:hypothetical protein
MAQGSAKTQKKKKYPNGKRGRNEKSLRQREREGRVLEEATQVTNARDMRIYDFRHDFDKV